MARRKRQKSRVPAMRSNAGSQSAFEFFGPSAERDAAVDRGMPEGEFGAIMFIGTVDNPANPPCPGPIVVHADGAIECEGGCAGVAHAYHGPGSTVACDVAGGSTLHHCSRCD